MLLRTYVFTLKFLHCRAHSVAGFAPPRKCCVLYHLLKIALLPSGKVALGKNREAQPTYLAKSYAAARCTGFLLLPLLCETVHQIPKFSHQLLRLVANLPCSFKIIFQAICDLRGGITAIVQLFVSFVMHYCAAPSQL